MIDAILERASPKTLAIAIITVFILVKISQWIKIELKIRALGGHAHKIRTWLPYGTAPLFRAGFLAFINDLSDVDLIARGINSTIHHKNLEAWQSWFVNRSTVEASPGGLRCIFTCDPENIKAILATQFNDYGKGEPFHEDWKDFLGDSIFTTDLDQWHHSRQLIRPQFIKDRVSDLEVFEEHVQVLIAEMRKAGKRWDGKQGENIDVSDLFFRYTLDAATHFLLGRSVGSLGTPEQEFAEAFAEVQRVQNIIARAG